MAEEIVISDKSQSGGEERLHLEEPATVFRHMQTLASRHRDLKTGRLHCVHSYGPYLMLSYRNAQPTCLLIIE